MKSLQVVDKLIEGELDWVVSVVKVGATIMYLHIEFDMNCPLTYLLDLN